MSDLFKDISDLTPEKRELLELLLQDEGIKVDSTLILPQERVWNNDLGGYRLPLSYAQKRLWFLDQFLPNSPLYNLPSAIRLTGELEVSVFERSINQIIVRHESLRTNFAEVDGEPYQIIKPELQFRLHETDLSGLPAEEIDAELNKSIEEEARKPFDLESDTLFRVELLRLAKFDYVVLLNMHHIISDGWSMGVLIREIVQLYEANLRGEKSPLEELPIQYADFGAWQQNWLQGEVLEEQLDYWREQLGENHPVLGLPTDNPRPAVQVGRGDGFFFELPTKISRGIRDLSQREGSTLFVTLLTAFAALLYRYTNQEDIRIGTPIAGRNRSEIQGLIGFFVNTLVMQAEFQGDPTFRDLLAQLRETAVGAYSHQDLPFEMLVDELEPNRDMSHPPLFQVMFLLQNAPNEVWELPGLKVSYLPVHTGTAKFDLSLILYEDTKAEDEYVLGGTLEYDADLFEISSIERIVEHFKVLLDGIITNPDVPIWDLPILSDAEQQQVLVDWNQTQTNDNLELCIHYLFQEQAIKTPDAIAVVYGDAKLSYLELNSKSNQLANYIQKLEVGPGKLVGVCMERSPEMVISMLGILKAGCAYVPIDPNYPEERQIYMIEDSQALVVLSTENLEKKLSGYVKNVVCLDEDWDEIARESKLNPNMIVYPNNLAYVLFTSGSTGLPKGVAIEHRSAVAMIRWARKVYSPDELKGVLFSTSISFDLSVYELFMTLSHGGTIILAENALELPDLPAKDHVTLINTVPSAIVELLRLDGIPESVQTVNLAGEPLVAEIVNKLYGKDHIHRVYDLYGPSEDTTYSTFALRESGGIEVIGKPISNSQVYLLDQHLRPVPVGVPGEIYIGGDGLAMGYLNRPGMTAERFLPNPFGVWQGSRMYKTGDLARYQLDGDLKFLGRIDNQVKLRGFRIELGEIEGVLEAIPEVKSALVMAREDAPGITQLVAYIVPNEIETDAGDDIRIVDEPQSEKFVEGLAENLREKLPDYMVPNAFVLLTAMPLTPNGKVDRNALPAPDREYKVGDKEYVGPRNVEEDILAGIWGQVLGLPDVSVTDNFFLMGGHSLLATQVLSRSRKAFDLNIPLRVIFDAPTIAEFAYRVDQLRREGSNLQLPPIQPIPRTGKLPLSFGQQRLWFLDQLEPDSPVYNIPDAIQVSGRLNKEALESSLNEIVRRHEVLRTTFATVEGKPIQLIAPDLKVSIPIIDLSELPEAETQAEIERLIFEESGQPFNLETLPLFRTSLLKLSENEWVILFTLHHSISDGWSTGVLMREVALLYPAFVKGMNADSVRSLLPELDIQYVDYAHWQQTWLSGEVLQTQLAYWEKQLAGIPPLLELPTDRPRPAVQSSRGEQELFTLSSNTALAVRELSQQEGVTLFMLMMAAFQALLYRYSGQNDVTIGTPIANRNRSEIEGLIGFFVNTLVMRADFSEDLNFDELLAQVREVALDAYAHQDIPFEMLVDVVQPERDLSHTPLFQVMFMLQNTAQEKIELPDLHLSRLDVNNGISMFDITLVISEAGGDLFGAVEYNADLFDRTTIQRFIRHYNALLDSVVSDPTQKVSHIQMMDEAEKQKVLVGWNETSKEFSQDVYLHQLFEARVEESPDAVAVVIENESLSYRELNRRANQLAHYLKRHDIYGERLVGVSVNRSVEMIVAILGVLKAGGAYVPLDPEYPTDRLEFIVRDSQLDIILTSGHQSEQLAGLGIKLVALDVDWEGISQESDLNPNQSRVSDNDLAYVIYTSGSTGLPKGVMIEHRSVVNFSQFCIAEYQIIPDDKVLQFATINFDTAVEEIFMTLLAGATLVLRNNEVLLSGEELFNMVEENGLTVLDLPTAYWHEWVHELLITEKNLPEGVRLVIVGGEKCLIERYENWLQVGGALSNWVNTYGPTEATVVSSVYWPNAEEMKRFSEVPIGRPISNGKLYILDKKLLPVPVGVSGELCIGGAGVARGYLNASNKSAEVFAPDPYSGIPGARLYRTGDLVRYLPDGNIEFIGRVDYQVKIRGFRVELGEIDTVLTKNTSVREAVTVAISSGSDHLRLVSYVVPLNSGDRTATDNYKKELREYLKDYLPEYMVPSAIMLLEELPISPSGKIDRRALPEPEIESVEVETEYVAPGTPEEEILTNVWSEVLGIERIGVHDNFFELGGDSILSIQVIARCGMAGLKLLPRNLFENPTISALAMVAEKGVKIEAEQGIVDGNVLMTPIQSWFFEQDLPNPNHYNQALMMKVNQPLNIGYLEEVVRALVSHHDALRLRFSDKADTWQQHNSGLEEASEGVDHLTHVDLSSTADVDVPERIEELAEEYQSGLDITNGPIFHVVVFDLGEKRPARLLIVAHHLAIDGISWRILLDDFQTAYAQVSSGKATKLPPKSTSFQLWANRLTDYAQAEAANSELAYWEMVSAKDVGKIPVDYTSGDNVEKSQKSVSVSLSEDETQALLKEVPSAYQTEINDVLLTALAQVTRLWTGGNSMLIEMEGHGREYLFEDVDISRTIGWFTSIFPVLIELAGNETTGEVLKSVKEQLRVLPNHGIGYGLLRYLNDDVAIKQTLAAIPHYELSFNYLGQFDQALPKDGIFGIAEESRGRDRDAEGIRGALIDINGGILRGQLTMEWSYSTNIHRRGTIERLANEYIEALRNIIKHCQTPEAEGFTPSDFPMADVDQKELEKLLGKIKQ